MNSLELGTARVGTLYDFDPSTPLIGAVLERLPEGIRVTVTWTEPDAPCATTS